MRPRRVAAAAAAAAKLLQLCPTLCNPIDGSPPGSSIPGTLQARTLEWVAISFSNAWKWKVKVKSLSRVPLLATPWTAAHQAPPSMGFSRQEYWSGVPLPSPRKNIPQHNKSHIWQTHSKHYPQWWKIESISSKIRDKIRVPTLTTTIQHSFGSSSHSNQRRKRNKRNPDWKRRSKILTVCRWHNLYIENPSDSTRKLLELINE